MTPEVLILAIDPGRDKCGLALVDGQGAILERLICPRDVAAQTVGEWMSCHPSAQLVLGDATTSRGLEDELRALLPDVPLSRVDERGSTLEARPLYWREHPPRGWRRIVPLSLQSPPVPLDDFAAVVLARRVLRG